VIRRAPLRTFALVFAAACAFAGCATLRARLPTATSIEPSAVSADDLLRIVDERSASLHTFRALAQMHYVGPKDSLAVKQIVVVARPNRLRIEMMSAFGVVLQVASDGEVISAYHRGERTFYHGRATAENLSRFTRLALDLRDIADLLVGLPPERTRVGHPSLTFERPLGWWKVSTALEGGGTLAIWFEPDSLLPVRALEADAQGTALYIASYEAYSQVAGRQIASDVRFEAPAEGTKIDLRYSNITVNAELPASLFSFEAPAGSKVVDLDAGEGP
jgi:outer membrane lipoprotein-sorting protein